MQKLTTFALMLLTIGLFAQAPLPQGVPGPNIPRGKAPEQGYVPEGWAPHTRARCSSTASRFDSAKNRRRCQKA